MRKNTERQIKERTGEINYNVRGCKMTIIKYIDARNVIIQFDNGFVEKTTYGNFKVGEILNLYDRTLCNIGYLGSGKYKRSENRKFTKEYNSWRAMIERCYRDGFSKKEPSYIGCAVCEEWQCFQTFAEWCNTNYYEVKDCKMALDKDILNKSNKIYSPKNCVFVPQDINCLFTKRQNDRGSYPIGVSLDRKSNTYFTRCSIGKKSRTATENFNTVDEAFNCYKIHKENYIKQVADKYKDQIPQNLYDALYSYKVEITD